MKSSFGRSFFTIATILLLSLVLLGTSFQMLINDYMTDNTIQGLKQDAQILADLAAAYSIDGSLDSREFMLNLDIATQISSFDAVICNQQGEPPLQGQHTVNTNAHCGSQDVDEGYGSKAGGTAIFEFVHTDSPCLSIIFCRISTSAGQKS